MVLAGADDAEPAWQVGRSAGRGEGGGCASGEGGVWAGSARPLGCAKIVMLLPGTPPTSAGEGWVALATPKAMIK